MVGLFDEKGDRLKETVDREEILQTAFEYWMDGKSFDKFVADNMDFFDISEKEIMKILNGKIKKIKAHPYDV